MWLSLQLCFISACLVIDRHGVSVHTALPTTDFLGRRECLRHREHSIPVPSSTESIQGKSSFHSGSIPVRLIFDRGLSVLEDDLRFAIFFLLVSARGRSRARASMLVISTWPRPLQLCFARANMNSTAKKKAYWPMCLPNGRHIGPIRLSMPGENTAKVKEKDARIVPCTCTVFLYNLSKKLVFLPLASAMTALHTCLIHLIIPFS